jgi:hypothetical protein
VTVSGNLIDAAASYCAANGGGSGTSGSPWHYNCIQAAVNAASVGDTVYLVGGNWNLSTGDATFVTVNKVINLVGAGSGNTFDAYGHINNPSGTDLCPTSGTSITCVYMTGTSHNTGGFSSSVTCVPGQTVGQNGCLNPAGFIWLGTTSGSVIDCANLSHIFFDGSLSTDGGDSNALVSMLHCNGSVINDVRHLSYNVVAIPNGETQFSPAQSTNITIENSFFGTPATGIVLGHYPGSQIIQPTGGNGIGSGLTALNNIFYQGTLNMIYQSSVTYAGNVQYNYNDGVGDSGIDPGFGYAGAGVGGPANVYCPETGISTGQCGGDFHFTHNNNLFYGPTHTFAIGSSVNDPTTSGGINDLNFTGNWLIAATPDIDSCIWHPFADQGNCTSVVNATFTGSISGTTLTVSGVTGTIGIGNTITADTPGVGSSTTISSGSGATWTINSSQSVSSRPMYAITPHVVGMLLNAAVDTACNESDNGTHYNITSNSLIGSTAAELNAQGTSWLDCKLGNPFSGNYTTIPIKVYGFNAQKNYLQSPSNQYLTNANSISPTQTGNFCSSAAGTVSGCATSGFTTPPTCSFAAGSLSGSTLPFTSTSFTAQYGAVQWLATTASTAPLSSDSRWSSNNGSFPNSAANSYIPPVSLASVSHGNTVYMWVMDSANQIASCGAVAIP